MTKREKREYSGLIEISSRMTIPLSWLFLKHPNIQGLIQMPSRFSSRRGYTDRTNLFPRMTSAENHISSKQLIFQGVI
jgi:hypothetical protein